MNRNDFQKWNQVEKVEIIKRQKVEYVENSN
jgi:hypothetical protein